MKIAFEKIEFIYWKKKLFQFSKTEILLEDYTSSVHRDVEEVSQSNSSAYKHLAFYNLQKFKENNFIPDFNEEKAKRIGERFEGGKLAKKVHKSIEQLKRHDPDVQISTEPTKVSISTIIYL